MAEINAGEGGERVVVSGTFRLPPGGLYAKPDDPVVVGVVAEDAEGRLVVEVGRERAAGMVKRIEEPAEEPESWRDRPPLF